MSTSLRSRLSELASSFATSVLDAVRGASLDELLAQASAGPRSSPSRSVDGPTAVTTRRRGKRLPRRSANDIAEVIESIVSLVKQNPGGLRAEQIREELSLQAKELPRPLKEALQSGRLSKSGQKRATTYFAKGGGSAAKATASRGSAPAPRGRRAAAAAKGRSRRRGKEGRAAGRAPKKARGAAPAAAQPS